MLLNDDTLYDWCARHLHESTGAAALNEEKDRHGASTDKLQLNGGGIHCSTCPLIRDSID